MQNAREVRRDDSRIIIHFDYDCFYASVVENENPALKSVPLAIQQKQIIVTCNYEARRRGLRKLQLITEAKQVCPEAVIILGEDLTRFRNASKELYNFLKDSIWSQRLERLGFDEVWLDCTDMINYNMDLLNHNALRNSFFCLSLEDPTSGFEYDASAVFGPTYPRKATSVHHDFTEETDSDTSLRLRLILGSHLARYLRHQLESQKGYTATVGIATNKILSKLVGNVNKPKSQTTIMPPYEPVGSENTTITEFMDAHDIGKVPGIGFKLAQKIRAKVLGREAAHYEGLVYGGTKESVTVRDVRTYPGMGPDVLEETLNGPGSQKGIGGKIWELIHGIDDIEVSRAKRVPSQISQEDSYMKYLYSFEQVKRQLFLLADRLITRMHIDLLEHDDEDLSTDLKVTRKWLAHPRTLRLSTRPRPPTRPDGTRARTFHRISRSAPMPKFVFNLNENVASIAERLVEEALVPMFRKLHAEKSGWNLSLINIAVTNMLESASEAPDSEGRDIGRMFRRQDDVLRDFKVIDSPDAPSPQRLYSKSPTPDQLDAAGETVTMEPQTIDEGTWDSDTDDEDRVHRCKYCQATLPPFALVAHQQYHELSN